MEKEIIKAIETLSAGKTILYPTDTIWGIGCDATSSRAVSKIYKIKQRVESKSLIILLDDADKLKKYVKSVPFSTYDILKSVDTPLTVIYPNAKNLAKNVIAPDGTIAIRIVKDKFCQELIKRFGKPIVSSSANISGQLDPYIYSKISNDIIEKVDYVVNVNVGLIRATKASRIIKMEENGEFKVIRE